MVDTAMTIGERLEEARKRKGISIREAAEATKVRGDYLLAMENNSFEISLPEIYVKGFLKIYVNYLRLDTEKMMEDYVAMRLSTQKTPRSHNQPLRREPSQAPTPPSVTTSGPQSGGRTSFGRMDMGQPEEPHHDQQGPSPLPPGARPDPGAPSAWLRPAIVVGGVVVVLVVIGVLIMTFVGGRKPDLNPELSSATAQGQIRTITLMATDNVTVWVTRKSDNFRVYEGTLTSGQMQKVDVSGAVEIRYTNGRGLQVERDGKRLRINTEGMGRSIVD
jgi:cytoskeleton protein RodZ